MSIIEGAREELERVLGELDDATGLAPKYPLLGGVRDALRAIDVRLRLLEAESRPVLDGAALATVIMTSLAQSIAHWLRANGVRLGPSERELPTAMWPGNRGVAVSLSGGVIKAITVAVRERLTKLEAEEAAR